MTNRNRVIATSSAIVLLLAIVLAYATCETSVFAEGDNPIASQTTSTLAEGPNDPDGASTSASTPEPSTSNAEVEAQLTDTGPLATSDRASSGGGAPASTGTSTVSETGPSTESTWGSADSSTGSATTYEPPPADSHSTTGSGSSSGSTGSYPWNSTGVGTPEAAALGLDGRILFTLDSYDAPIKTINADGSEHREVGVGREPRVSPDGRKISYVEWNDGFLGYWVANWDGSHRLKVQDFDAGTVMEWTGAANWASDGNSVILAVPSLVDCGGPLWAPTCQSNPDGGVWTAAADGSDLRHIVRGEAVHPTFSPAGDLIAFARGTALVVANIDGTLERPVYQASSGVLIRPSFSPDGSSLAFMVTRPRVDKDLVTHDVVDVAAVDVTGLNYRALVTDRQDVGVREPAWSPNGDMIAFADALAIYVANADGSNVHEVGRTGADDDWMPSFRASPSWSPGGEWLAMGAADPNVGTTPEGYPKPPERHLYVVRPDGTDLTMIATVAAQEPQWVP